MLSSTYPEAAQNLTRGAAAAAVILLAVMLTALSTIQQGGGSGSPGCNTQPITDVICSSYFLFYHSHILNALASILSQSVYKHCVDLPSSSARTRAQVWRVQPLIVHSLVLLLLLIHIVAAFAARTMCGCLSPQIKLPRIGCSRQFWQLLES